MSFTLTSAGKMTGRVVSRTLLVACASLALVTSAQAQHRGGGGWHGGGAVHVGGPGWHGGGHYGGPRYRGGGYYRGGNGWVWGGLGLGLGLGLASAYASPWYYGDPGYVVVNPPIQDAPVYAAPAYAAPVYSTPVPVRSQQPVIYPRNGQNAARTDADASQCSEWAGQQPNATADPSVFHRGQQACMDARGYTVR